MTKQKTIVHLIGNTTKPNTYPIASEYIRPGGQINITSHGLGSGVYGLTKSKYKQIVDNLPRYLSKRHSVFVKIKNPFIVNSHEYCDKLINWSMQLNGTLEKYKDKFLSKKLSLHLISNIFSTNFNSFSKHKLTKKKCRRALRKFFLDYVKRDEFLCMPINYILRELKFDGIYAEGSACDSMSKGNIKFVWYPNKNTKKIVTNIFNVRNGTRVNRIIIPNFMYVKGVVLKHPDRFKNPDAFRDWKLKHGIKVWGRKNNL